MKTKILVISRFGIEKITANEIQKLGYKNIEIQDGQITLEGEHSDVARLNIFLRTAERVMIVIKEFRAVTFEELFQGIKSIEWPDILPADAFIHITAKSFRSELFSVRDIQSISKKAIIEKLKQKYKKEWFEESGNRYRIETGIFKDKVSVMLDTSGEGLHKRGYRRLTSEAPLSETLAAAIILLSFWNSDRTLLDPFCGSGTIPVEAALIGTNRAPGLSRDFRAAGFEHYFDVKYFDIARDEAKDMIDHNIKLKIIGSDIDDEEIKKARYHASLAGVDDKIHFQTQDVKDISSKDKYGVIIANPPYGERLMEKSETIKLYKETRESFNRFDTWSKYILSAYKGFESIYGQKADKRRKIYNGMIECQLYQYFGPKPPKKTE
jgi:putative N6-adenine-specific DNA methylase